MDHVRECFSTQVANSRIRLTILRKKSVKNNDVNSFVLKREQDKILLKSTFLCNSHQE